MATLREMIKAKAVRDEENWRQSNKEWPYSQAWRHVRVDQTLKDMNESQVSANTALYDYRTHPGTETLKAYLKAQAKCLNAEYVYCKSHDRPMGDITIRMRELRERIEREYPEE